ncbi:MAG: hypothetical protein ABJK28_17445 [Algibacter sp.]
MKGILSKPNLSVFKNQFNDIFEKVNKITISIENIEWMDKHGVQALANLHIESIIKNKELSIIGLGCKELYEHFTIEMPSKMKRNTAA